MFDTTTPPTDGQTMYVNHYIKIVAFAEGGEWDYLRFEVKVQICGDETVDISTTDSQGNPFTTSYTYTTTRADQSPMD